MSIAKIAKKSKKPRCHRKSCDWHTFGTESKWHVSSSIYWGLRAKISGVTLSQVLIKYIDNNINNYYSKYFSIEVAKKAVTPVTPPKNQGKATRIVALRIKNQGE